MPALPSASLKGELETGVFFACTHRGPCCVVCRNLGGPDNFVIFVNFASARHSLKLPTLCASPSRFTPAAELSLPSHVPWEQQLQADG